MSAYRFPVYLLGAGDSPADCLLIISAWCVVEMGAESLRANGIGSKTSYNGFNKLPALHGADPDFDSATDAAREVVLGQIYLGQHGGAVHWYQQQHKIGQSKINAWRSKYGPPSYVSIGSSILWEQINHLRDGKPADLNYRQFALLCAVNCAIGDKTHPFPVTRDFLRAAAVGYKKAEHLLRDGDPIHSIQQLRDDLDQLERQKLIGRVVLSRRATAYYLPNRCSRTDALEWLKVQSEKRMRGVDLRAEEREVIQRTTRNHSEPLGTTRNH